MENFEVGTACCWTKRKFVAGERAMKCLTCGIVTTNMAWEEKRKCFHGHTNSVSAIAVNPNVLPSPRPPRLVFQDLPPVRPRRRRQLEWRDPPPVRPRRQLEWRDIKTTQSKVIAISAIVLLLLFLIIFMLKK